MILVKGLQAYFETCADVAASAKAPDNTDSAAADLASASLMPINVGSLVAFRMDFRKLVLRYLRPTAGHNFYSSAPKNLRRASAWYAAGEGAGGGVSTVLRVAVRLEPLTLSTKLSMSVLIIALNLTIDVSSLAERPFMGRRVRSGPLMRAIDERNAIKQPSAIAPRTSRSAIFRRTSFTHL